MTMTRTKPGRKQDEVGSNKIAASHFLPGRELHYLRECVCVLCLLHFYLPSMSVSMSLLLFSIFQLRLPSFSAHFLFLARSLLVVGGWA